MVATTFDIDRMKNFTILELVGNGMRMLQYLKGALTNDKLNSNIKDGFFGGSCICF
jgi:hypothetical protein